LLLGRGLSEVTAGSSEQLVSGHRLRPTAVVVPARWRVGVNHKMPSAADPG
jgi:hypothetical protein